MYMDKWKGWGGGGGPFAQSFVNILIDKSICKRV